MSENENNSPVPDITPRRKSKNSNTSKRISLSSLQFTVIPATQIDVSND